MVRLFCVVGMVLALCGCTHVTRGSGFGPFYTSDGVEIRGTGEGCLVFASYGYDGKGRRAVKFYKLTIIDHGVVNYDAEFVFPRPQFDEHSWMAMESGARSYSQEFGSACRALFTASPEKKEVYARYFEEAVVLAVEFLTRADKAASNAEFDIEDKKYFARFVELFCRRPFDDPESRSLAADLCRAKG